MPERYLRFAIIAYFFIYAGTMAFLTPPYEGPDEIAHLEYMNFLARNHRLPDQTDPMDGGITSWEHHQPPLYYVLGAAVLTLAKSDHAVDINLEKHGRWVRPPGADGVMGDLFVLSADRNIFYLFRLLSVLMGAVTLVYVFRTSSLLLPADARAWTVFPGLFVATLPQFAFDSAILNNDSLANLLAAAAIYYAYAAADQAARSRNYVGLGISLGLGLLAKKTLLVLLPMVLVLLVAAVLKGNRKRRIVALSSIAVALTVLIASGWYLRNYRLYGKFLAGSVEEKLLPYLVHRQSLFSEWFVGSYWHSPGASLGTATISVVGILMTLVVAGYHGFPRAIRLSALTVLGLAAAISPVFFRDNILDRYVGKFAAGLYTSFIGNFGQMSLPLPDAIYVGYGIVMGIASTGLLFELSEKGFRDLKILIACGFVACAVAGVTYYNLTFVQPQGRLLFPALAPLACLVSVGLYALLSGPRFRSVKQCALIAVLWLFAIADGVSIWQIYGY
jgi:4-amino-4-deoxy-L-arabinose transferase-like glycosyltransferase